MLRIFVLILCLTLLPALAVKAEQTKQTEKSEQTEKAEVVDDAKMVSGMSIVGNDEAPKALYIVPWKSSEIGVETGLSMMLTESDMPVDRDVFMRQLDFFEVSTADTRRED